jgi:hypothetical protein
MVAVLEEGVEPSRFWAAVFEAAVSAIPPLERERPVLPPGLEGVAEVDSTKGPPSFPGCLHHSVDHLKRQESNLVSAGI